MSIALERIASNTQQDQDLLQTGNISEEGLYTYALTHLMTALQLRKSTHMKPTIDPKNTHTQATDILHRCQSLINTLRWLATQS